MGGKAEKIPQKPKNKTQGDSEEPKGKTETYLEAIRKNIEWLKKHNKQANKEDLQIFLSEGLLLLISKLAA
uniref:Uncharacterized protein n=1 Tax=Sphaerodactylus townsendi TaxID=933632 RepID=A0ACB8E5L8_9SAUR